ncbi:MAG: hypothetical protein Ct9H90mP30_2020 [Actinomycetota bacterium]|nr:MAG: hypothetical protein Ct9H90mP30_2020 [Actinomycetota bacterium]
MAFPMLFAFGLITYLSFLSILKANEIGTTGQVSVIGYFLPLFGVVGGAMFFDEELDASFSSRRCTYPIRYDCNRSRIYPLSEQT